MAKIIRIASHGSILSNIATILGQPGGRKLAIVAATRNFLMKHIRDKASRKTMARFFANPDSVDFEDALSIINKVSKSGEEFRANWQVLGLQLSVAVKGRMTELSVSASPKRALRKKAAAKKAATKRTKKAGVKTTMRSTDKTPGATRGRMLRHGAAKKAVRVRTTHRTTNYYKSYPPRDASDFTRRLRSAKLPRKPTVGRSSKGAPERKKVTCYFRAGMAAEIELKKLTMVTCTISREQIKSIKGEVSESRKAEVTLVEQLKVIVRAIKNIRINGDKTKARDVPEPRKPVKLDFQVLATHVGECSMGIDVFQGQVPVCTMVLNVICSSNKTPSKMIEAKVRAASPDPYPTKVTQLQIRPRTEGRKLFYDYILDSEELNIWKEYTSLAINGSPEIYINKLYQEIEELWDTVANDEANFQENLRSYGSGLFRKLFPRELQEIFYENRNKLKSIQLLSSEPFVPWELLLVRHPDETKPVNAEDPFLGELGVTRWLLGWRPSGVLQIRKGKARFVIPKYEDVQLELPAGEEERSYLEDHFKALEIEPDPVKVLMALRKRDMDLLHFCCHGEAETKNITNGKLMLAEKLVDGKKIPAYLTQTTIEEIGDISNGEDRPMIVLNSCSVGRLGKSLVGYGGFANAFLKSRAGAFVGPLWSIEDDSAISFIRSFYDTLKEGKTLAEATITARESAREKKDATWISYVVYGHPFAKLKK